MVLPLFWTTKANRPAISAGIQPAFPDVNITEYWNKAQE
jgi:hypothetical protein